MNSIKRIGISGIAALIFFTSCSKQIDSVRPDIKNNNISKTTEEVLEYRIDTDKIFDTDEVICERLIDRYNDGFVFTGIASCTESDFVTVSGETGGKTETGLFAPADSVGNLISVKKKDDTIYFLCGKNGKGSVTAFNPDGTVTKKTELDYYPTDFEIRDKIYILDSSERKVSVYSETFELEECFDVTYKLNGVSMFPGMMAVSPENDIYCIIYDKTDSDSTKIMQAGSENKIICESIDDMENVSDIFTNSSGNIIITGKENDKCLVDVLDKNGSIVSMTEIRNCDEVYGITDSDKIIFSNSEGISSFRNDETELIIDSEEFEDNSIYACCMESDGCTAYLCSDFDDYHAVFISDKENNIISEIKADSIDDCFVRDERVYVSGVFDGEHTVKVFDNETIMNTGIKLDNNRSKYNIGVLPSGDILIGTYEEETFDIYSDSFEFKSSVNTGINSGGFFKSNTSLYCYDDKNIYRINENYNLGKIDTGFDENAGSMIFASGNDEYEFLISVSSGIYGLSTADKSAVLLVDYNKEIISDVWSLVISEDKRILIGSLYNVCEAKLIKTVPGQYQEKQKLVLAYNATGEEDIKKLLKKSVNLFNDESEKYFIEMKGYKSSEDSLAESLLALDIISGKIPDIVTADLLSENIATMLKDNALTDMYPYIENDNELSVDAFYSSVLDAFTYKEKLYSVPLIIRAESGLTVDNISTDTCEQLIDNISSKYDSDINYIDISYGCYLTELYLNENINYGTSVFNLSEAKINKIVSFLRNYVLEMTVTDFGDFDYSDKRKICQAWFFSSTRAYYYYKNLEDGQDVSSELGFPGSKGLIFPKAGISVMKNCENKDAAWDFIKTCSRCIEKDNENELYAIKTLNVIPGESTEIMDNFELFMEGPFVNSVLYDKLSGMIYNEMYENPDVSDEEISRTIYNKMKLYFAEIQ